MSPPLIPGAVGPVAPIVQIGIGDRYDAAAVAGLWGGPGVVGPARWSTAGAGNTWGGQEPLWNDVTCEVLEMSTFAGRDGSVDKFAVGTATVTLRNLDGWADYKPAGANDNILTVRPGRQVRIGVAIGAGPPQWLWRGVIDTTEPGYRPDEGDTVTIGCIDAKGDAGRAAMPREVAPVGVGDPAYSRAWRVLHRGGWPFWRYKYDVDNVVLNGTDLGNQVADELDRTAESASGHIYGDLDGKVTFRRKDWMVWEAADPLTATIGNVGSGDICPSGWEIHFSRDDITTRVIAGRERETPLVVDNPEAFGLYGSETWERLDLLPTDNFEMSRIASRVLSVRSPDRMPRIAAVVLDAATGAGEVAAVLAVASPFTPTRLRCRHRAWDGRAVFDRTMMVTGVAHTISPTDGWVTRLALDDATPYLQPANPGRWSGADTRWSTDDQWAMSL